MKTIKILNRMDSNKVIYESNQLTIKKAVEEAVKNKVSLKNADLRGANLENVNLMGADLRNADLFKTNLTDVNYSNITFFGIERKLF